MTHASTATPELLEMSIEMLKPADDNVRRDVGDITELVASIKSMGVLEPLIAVQENGHYLLVAGARRLAGATKAGLKTVPVVVREMTDAERVQAMLIENLHREDLTPREEAEALHRLVDEFKITQRELATRVGRSQSHISKRLALIGLPEMVLTAVDSGGITLAEAAEIARLGGDTKHIQLVLDRPGYQSVESAVEAVLRDQKKEEILRAREEDLESQAIPTVRVANLYNLSPGVHRLKGDAGGYDPHALQMTPKEHESHGCHAIALYLTYEGKLGEFPVCTDRKQHPKVKTKQEVDRTSQSSANAKREADRQKLEQAQMQRLAFERALLSGKALSKTAITELVVNGMINRAIELGEEDLSLAAVMLGLIEPDETSEIDERDALIQYIAGGEAQRLRAAAAFALAADESYHLWPSAMWGGEAAEHLAFLERHGYEISAAEKSKLPKQAKAA